MFSYAEDNLPPGLVFQLWPFVTYCERTLRDKRTAFQWGSFVLRTQLAAYFVPEAYERIYTIMPRAKKGTKHDETTRTRTPISWVNIPLPDDVELYIENRWPTGEHTLSDMVSLVGEGWSFSIKHDDRGNGFVCFATAEFVQGDRAGVGITGRAAEPLDACNCALYRLEVVLSDGYTPPAQVEKRRFR